MSFPVVAAVNGGGETSDATNHTVNLPAGIVAGNLLLVFFCSDDDAEAITFPGGWTQLFQDSGSTYMTFGAWYRIADGTEGATITVTTASAEMTAHTSYRITGYIGVPEVGVSVTATSTAPNPPNLAPTWGALDTLWFAVEGNDDGTTLVSGWPANYGSNRNDKGLNSLGCAIGTCRRELNAAAEDPAAFTIDASERWVANIVAIKPVTLPTVTTADATLVEEVTATTGGNITAIGGANATRRGVKYGLTPGARTWDSGEDGDFGTGAFTRNLTGLTKGELYYFEAYATNPAGTSYGAEKSFLTKPDEPTALDAVPGDEVIALSWTEGTGSQKTMIRFRTDGVYPTDPANGTEAFFAVGNTFDHTELTNGHTYLYRAWSYATEGGLERYSDSYSSAEATPAAIPSAAPTKFFVELHDSTGGLVAILEKVYDASYEEELNTSRLLDFKIPADDSKVAYIILANEIWLRDAVAGTVIRKFKLKYQLDIRDGSRISTKITAKDYFSQLTDIVFDFEAGRYMSYVAATAATLSNPIASDDDYFYVADNVNWKVKKYLKSDMSLVATQATNYAGNITTMAVDATHVYIGGWAATQNVWKLLKSDLSYIAATVDYGGVISTLAVNDTHIYVGGATTNRVRKYLKSTMAYVAQTVDYGGAITALAINATHIFACGQTTLRVRKYLAADMSYITQSQLYGGVPDAIVLDATYVYVGGATANKVWQLLVADLTFVAEGSYAGDILALVQDDDYVYAGGTTAQTINRYNKTPFLLRDISPVAGAIYGLTIDDLNIYAVGTGFVAVKKYSLFDTVEDIIDELLSFQVNVPAVTKGTIAAAYKDLVRDIQANGETIAEVLLNLRDTLGGYIEVNNDRELDWHENVGEDTGQQIRYKKNLVGMERDINWTGLFNRIYAYGQTTAGVKVRLSEIQAEDYVEDVPSQTAWGGIYSKSFVMFSITSPETLLSYALEMLAELKDPPMSYRVKSVDLATQPGFTFDRLRLGSIVKVIDEDMGIDIEAKVVKIRHPDLFNPLNMEVDIAVAVRDITGSIVDMERTVKKHQNLLSG
jgi:hypothetical protein